MNLNRTVISSLQERRKKRWDYCPGAAGRDIYFFFFPLTAWVRLYGVYELTRRTCSQMIKITRTSLLRTMDTVTWAALLNEMLPFITAQNVLLYYCV